MIRTNTGCPQTSLALSLLVRVCCLLSHKFCNFGSLIFIFLVFGNTALNTFGNPGFSDQAIKSEANSVG